MPVINQVKNTDFFCPKNVDDMADRIESEIPKVATVSFIRCLDINGNSGSISTDNLFKNLFQNRSSSGDANKDVQNGIYGSSSMENVPVRDYCTLLVFRNSIYIHQFYFPLNTFSIFYRYSINGGNSWYEWKSISFTN